MEAFIERLLGEKDQLSDRVEKLNKFINTNPKFNELDSKMQILMNDQYYHMTKYLECLNKRIKMLID